MLVILVLVAVLAVFRFVASTAYLLVRLVSRACYIAVSYMLSLSSVRWLGAYSLIPICLLSPSQCFVFPLPRNGHLVCICRFVARHLVTVAIATVTLALPLPFVCAIVHDSFTRLQGSPCRLSERHTKDVWPPYDCRAPKSQLPTKAGAPLIRSTSSRADEAPARPARQLRMSSKDRRRCIEAR